APRCSASTRVSGMISPVLPINAPFSVVPPRSMPMKTDPLVVIEGFRASADSYQALVPEDSKGLKGMSIFAKCARILRLNECHRLYLNNRMYELLQRYGLWAVFFGTMIEGDLTLLFSGVLARAGLFTFEEAFLVGTAGGFVGDSLSYMIGARFRGRARTWHFFIRARLRIEKLMRKFGVLSVFIVKYVYGLRTTSAIFYGLAQFGFLRF